jgi:actin-related protein 6
MGGKIMTNFLKEIISFRYWDMMHETVLINAMKEQLCYVARDFAAEMRLTKSAPPCGCSRRCGH